MRTAGSWIPGMLTLALLTSCSEIETASYAIVGRVREVSAQDTQLAIDAVRQRCIADRLTFAPVYRIEVINRNEIEVDCGPHYGSAQAAGALTFTVERTKGSWHVTSVQQYVPNPERVIVT